MSREAAEGFIAGGERSAEGASVTPGRQRPFSLKEPKTMPTCWLLEKMMSSHRGLRLRLRRCAYPRLFNLPHPALSRLRRSLRSGDTLRGSFLIPLLSSLLPFTFYLSPFPSYLFRGLLQQKRIFSIIKELQGTTRRLEDDDKQDK